MMTVGFNLGLAQAALSPGEETLQYSKTLKPISDDQWKIITSNQPSIQYSVIQGDNLHDISKRLFGDSKYWPKIWALNNPKITNPHWIRPGLQLALSPGTGSSLPAVSVISDAPGPAVIVSETKKEKSVDWKNLPRQRWEHGSQLPLAEVDAMGFDRKNRIAKRTDLPADLHSIISSEEIELDGTVYASTRAEATFMTGDTVYIESPKEYAQNQILAVTSEPYEIEASGSGRDGYSYPILGTIKIEGKLGQYYVGKILMAQGLLKRTLFVMPMPEKLVTMADVSAAQELKGEVIKDPSSPALSLTQHSQIVIDLGSEDGVQKGMIVRVYSHTDPVTGDEITPNNEIPFCEAQIIQVSTRHSMAFVRKCGGVIPEGSEALLVVDPNAQPAAIVEAPLEPTAEASPSPEETPAPPEEAPAETPIETPPDPGELTSPDELLPPGDLLPPTDVLPPTDLLPPETPAVPDLKAPLPKPNLDGNAFDDLDSLDKGEALDDTGKKELQQLEDWKGNPPQIEVPLPPAAPTINPDDLVPSL